MAGTVFPREMIRAINCRRYSLLLHYKENVLKKQATKAGKNGKTRTASNAATEGYGPFMRRQAQA
jgi:hypothetical protein